jgi:hypothetical protein
MDRVIGLDAGDGGKLWVRPYVDPTAVIAAGGLLFVTYGGIGSQPGAVDVLRAGDGTRIGRFAGADTVQAGDGVVYIWAAISGQGIYVVRPGSGSRFGQVWSAPDTVVQQVTSGVVFTAGGSALRGSDGAPLCAFPAGVTVQLVADGVAYGSEYSSTTGEPASGLSAVDLRDGAHLWTYQAGSTVLAVSGGAAYVSDSLADDPAVYAVRVSDGACVWARRTVSLGSPSLVVQRDMIYVGTGSPLASAATGGGGRVGALRTGDGTEVWGFPTLGAAPASLATAPGVIYVCDGGLGGMGPGDGGRVAALRAGDGAGAVGVPCGRVQPDAAPGGWRCLRHCQRSFPGGNRGL